MAELSDLLIGGSQRQKDVDIEMLDYDFLKRCDDLDLIRAILRRLKSGEDGHYPDLLKSAEARLLEVLPPLERKKIIRMRAEPGAEEVFQATEDLYRWEVEVSEQSRSSKNIDGYPHAPIWTSHTDEESGNGRRKPVDPRSTLQIRDDNLHGEEPTNTHESGQTKPTKLGAYDFRAWEKFDVEKEIERMEEEEQIMQRRRDESIASMKSRLERDVRRRAEKREDQLRELGEERFKKDLSTAERKRAAEKEHQKGKECYKAKEYEEAFRFFTYSLALDDTNARAYSNRAMVAQKLERFDQAEDDCTRAITLDPEYKKAWIRRGTTRHSRGKYAGAITDFTQALRLDPDDNGVRNLWKHSAAKEREVEGERIGRKQDAFTRRQGRVLIEEVDKLKDIEDEKDSAAQQSAQTILGLPPSSAFGSRRTLIAQGWMEHIDLGPAVSEKPREGDTQSAHARSCLVAGIPSANFLLLVGESCAVVETTSIGGIFVPTCAKKPRTVSRFRTTLDILGFRIVGEALNDLQRN